MTIFRRDLFKHAGLGAVAGVATVVEAFAETERTFHFDSKVYFTEADKAIDTSEQQYRDEFIQAFNEGYKS